jgi:GNAT superfamily N-acetyltransferase
MLTPTSTKRRVNMDGYTIKALDESTWPDFAAMVERNSGLFSGCWCTWFHPQVREGDEPNRVYKERMVREGVAHAALVFEDGDAVAWAEYGTPDELPNIHHRKQYNEGVVTPPDYRITCIYVDKRHRRAGLAAVALRGALDLIAGAGGGRVEGYPQDTPGKKVNPSFLYNTTRHTYEEAGFAYDRPKGKNHCVMTMTVEPAGDRTRGTVS